MGAVLVMLERLRGEVETLACRGYPGESCGLLLGRTQPGERHFVQHQHPARNLASGHDRYELDPQDYFAAEMAATAAGIAVIGVWHSHPDHPARPSATDREWAWPGWSYLIVSVAAGKSAEVRSWRLDDKDFVEEEILYV